MKESCLQHKITVRHSDSSRLWAVLSCALMLVACAAGPLRAAPSCGLENWLTTLNESANTYVEASDPHHKQEAARAFRSELERYGRENLLKQIDAADLGNNREAMIAFIEARRHLLDLHEDDWSEMAERFGSDPRFRAQSENMQRYLNAHECDEDAPDFLSPKKEDKKNPFMARVSAGLSELSEIFEESEESKSTVEDRFAADNFDEFRPSHTSANPSQSAIPLSKTGNAAFVLGIFTFVISASVWFWMRYTIAQRRSVRFTCSLPVVMFDGVLPTLGEVLDLSQIGAKIDTQMQLRKKQKIKLTIGPTKVIARVIWQNQHFVGVHFTKSLSEAEINELLGPYAEQVARDREEMGAIRFAEEYDLPSAAPTAVERFSEDGETDGKQDQKPEESFGFFATNSKTV